MSQNFLGLIQNKLYFRPKIRYLRYDFVKKLIQEYNAKSVIDIGCGDCSFLKEVTKLNKIGRLVGVDLNPAGLARGAATFTSEFDDEQNSGVRRKIDLEVEVFHFSINALVSTF